MLMRLILTLRRRSGVVKKIQKSNTLMSITSKQVLAVKLLKYIVKWVSQIQISD